jgi:GTP-binding protein
MRREGFEFEVGPPRVIYRHENGKRMEPIELASVDVPESKASTVMGIMLERRAEFTGMTQRGSLQHLEFTIPSRGVIGLRTVLMTATQGDATLYTVVQGYGPYRGDISRRRNGGLISMCDGNAIAFAIFNIQDRGRLFTAVGQPVYEGLIVGECARENDLIVNLTKEKRLTNVRSAGAEEAVRIVPPIQLSLEEALEYIDDDELVEITPKSIRLRKAIRDGTERKRAGRDTQ